MWIQPIEYTLQKLQSNSEVICLLPPGGCSIHHKPEEYSESEFERRPRTSYRSHNNVHHRGLPLQTSKEIIVETDNFAVSIALIRDDLR